MPSKLFVTLTLVFAVVGSAGCRTRSDNCRNTIEQQIGYPGGKSKAVIFVRACSPAEPFYTEVSVLPSLEQLPATSGNVFVADTNFGVNVSWANGTELVISYDKRAHVVRNESSIGDVHIRY